MKEEDAILITALEFYAYHGASDEEQVVGHRYSLDIRLTVDCRPAAASDSVADTVNYAEVAALLLEVGTSAQYRLLERLSDRMLSAVFARFPIVQEAALRLQKISPPLPAIAASVGVEISRSRADYASDTTLRLV